MTMMKISHFCVCVIQEFLCVIQEFLHISVTSAHPKGTIFQCTVTQGHGSLAGSFAKLLAPLI
jgi:hypothetical protein